MALTTVEVPYRHDYDIGVGADLASGSPMGYVVAGDAEGVTRSGGATVSFTVQRITTTDQLQQSLGIDAQASFGSGMFGAGISARFGFSKNCAVQSSSLFMAITAQVNLQYLSIKEPQLAPNAAAMVDNPTVFTERYGNMFVRGLARGGLFVGVFRFDVHGEQEQEQISAELDGSYGLFSASVSSKFNNIRSTYHADALVSMYHEGGPVDLEITDPTQPSQLLDNANRWLASFGSQPDASAVPYSVTLAPITIAEGPLPPNAADLEHAQDIIVLCAEQRSQILDNINLLSFVLQHASDYDWTGDPTPTTTMLDGALDGFQQDLDLIADCASLAINHPEQAATPATFAQGSGRAYPAGTMPTVMPTPKPFIPSPGTITVPGYLGLSNDDIDAAERWIGANTVDELEAGIDVYGDGTEIVTLASFGMNRAQAEFISLAQQGQAGFTCDPDMDPNLDDYQNEYIVVSQTLQPGATVPQGTELVLHLDQAPPPPS